MLIGSASADGSMSATHPQTYPTDSKERQKARLKELKESGQPYAPKCAKKKVYDQHFDDCGNDWSGLGKDHLWIDGFADDDEYDDYDLVVYDYDYTDHFDTYWFGGLSGIRDSVPVAMRRYGDVHLFASTTALEIFVSRTEDAEVDVCEIAGGAARTSTILARCRVKIGKNYDLIAGSDMTNADEQKAFMKFSCSRRTGFHY